MTEFFNESSCSDQHRVQGNLISSLVRASTDEKSITAGEVISNIFDFRFADHDMIAHSFAFTFMLLAGNSEVQDQMAEEINHVFDGKKDLENQYELFPRLVYTLAVLVCLVFPVLLITLTVCVDGDFAHT